MTCSQSVVYPVAGTGGPASAFGNVNNAPTIASAKKALRSCCLMFCLFINLIPFSCFGLPWLFILKNHFQPFTDVQPEIRGEVTRKIWEQPRIRLRQGYGVIGYADYSPSRYGWRGEGAVF